jgi:hypothetical protein
MSLSELGSGAADKAVRGEEELPIPHVRGEVGTKFNPPINPLYLFVSFFQLHV